MTYTVGPKGQIVIAKEIRDRLGVKPGWVALQRLVEDRVEVYFMPPEHVNSLKGSLSSYLHGQVLDAEALAAARQAAWEAAVQDKWTPPEIKT